MTSQFSHKNYHMLRFEGIVSQPLFSCVTVRGSTPNKNSQNDTESKCNLQSKNRNSPRKGKIGALKSPSKHASKTILCCLEKHKKPHRKHHFHKAKIYKFQGFRPLHHARDSTNSPWWGSISLKIEKVSPTYTGKQSRKFSNLLTLFKPWWLPSNSSQLMSISLSFLGHIPQILKVKNIEDT